MEFPGHGIIPDSPQANMQKRLFFRDSLPYLGTRRQGPEVATPTNRCTAQAFGREAARERRHSVRTISVADAGQRAENWRDPATAGGG